MRRLAIPAMIAVCVAVLSLGGSGHRDVARAQEPGPRLAIARVDTSNFPEMAVIVTVTSATGQPATGLGSADFRVDEEGQPISDLRVENVVDAQTPVLVVLAVDISGSMKDEKLSAAKAAAEAFIGQLQPIDEVAVVSFADTVNVFLNPTKVGDLPQGERLGPLAANGNTALYDGAYQAVRIAAESRLARRAVILLTDGEDYGGLSMFKREDVLRLASDTGVPIFSIGVGSDADMGFLHELSVLARGEAVAAPSPDQLFGLFLRIGALLRNQYQLAYRSGVLGDSKPHSLHVAVNVAGQQLTADATFASEPVPPEISAAALDDVIGKGKSPSGTVELEPTIKAQGREGETVRVEYLLDGDVVHTTSEPPFRYVLNVDALERGDHVLAIRATDQSGNVGTKEYSFKISGAAFNWAFVFLVAGIAIALAFGALILFRARRRRRVLVPTPSAVDEQSTDTTQSLERSELIRPSARQMAGGMSASLLVKAGPERGRSFEIEIGGEPVVMGRASECDVVLADPQQNVSREHARLWQEAGALWIQDLGSTNGTKVNGKGISKARLEPGDEIQMGHYRLELVVNPAPTVQIEEPGGDREEKTREWKRDA